MFLILMVVPGLYFAWCKNFPQSGITYGSLRYFICINAGEIKVLSAILDRSGAAYERRLPNSGSPEIQAVVFHSEKEADAVLAEICQSLAVLGYYVEKRDENYLELLSKTSDHFIAVHKVNASAGANLYRILVELN